MNIQSKNVSKQGGFTLIELMIVITIIGILASIAVPAYRDYTIRSRVAECASLFGPLKTDTSLLYSETGNLPTGLADLPRSSDTATDYSGDYVTQIDVDANGVATCTLSSDTTLGLGPAAGQDLDFEPATTAQSVNWTISSSSSVDPKFWPNVN